MNHQQFTALFRDVASKHKLINHSESRPAFARLILSADPYLPVHEQLEDFLSKNQKKLRDPFMLLTNYEARYRNQKGDDKEKHLAARMIILKQVRPGDHEGEEAALTLTEKIGEQCLAYIENWTEESEETAPYGFFDWNGTETERISKLTDRNLFGTAFNLVIQVPTVHTYFNSENFNI